jgi:hypothetical protein
MAQFYNLEEAARVLGLSPEELKAKAQQREVRYFTDRGSMQFRSADIDELARRRGLGSDPDLSLSDLDLPQAGGGVADVDPSEFQIGVTNPDLGTPSKEFDAGVPAPSSQEEDILLDDQTVSARPHNSSSSTIIGMAPAGRRQPDDSDVRLVPDDLFEEAGESGVHSSDEALGGRTPSDSDVTLIADDSGSSIETEAVREEGGRAGGPRPIPAVGSSGEVKSTDFDDSDFDLTPSSALDALEPHGGSDFELEALDASDEFDTASKPRPSDSDVTGAEPTRSGINLGRPSDSGINLQSVGFLDDADSIELAPLDEEEPAPPPKPKPAAPAPAKPRSDLAATDVPTGGNKDIFEDTDFEVDVLEPSSEDRTVQLEADSDFDLDEGEGGSEVFALDEDDVDQNAATALGPASSAVVEEEEAEEEAEDLEGAWDEEETPSPTPSRSGPSPVLASAGATAEWGGLWVGLLIVTTVFTLLLTFVTMDVVSNLYEFRGSNPVSSGLVKSIAGLFGG